MHAIVQKNKKESYEKILSIIRNNNSNENADEEKHVLCIFVSDIVAELDAAREAGLQF